ncbi:hypothetical protein NC652_025674 [Populus alba x Populus x berolinensis]|nr:hypothetical protein NC652_025674 [Populus alba x Populus x berolinensis]
MNYLFLSKKATSNRSVLDERTARNTIANNKVTNNLTAVIHEAGVTEGCNRTIGNLLYTNPGYLELHGFICFQSKASKGLSYSRYCTNVKHGCFPCRLTGHCYQVPSKLPSFIAPCFARDILTPLSTASENFELKDDLKKLVDS